MKNNNKTKLIKTQKYGENHVYRLGCYGSPNVHFQF